MKIKIINNKLSLILISLLVVLLSACGGSGPVKYNAASGAPYEGLYEVDKMNSSCKYSYSKGVNNFSVTMKWRTSDENIDYAKLTDEYYLEYSYDDLGLYELCKPVNDMSALKNKEYTIKPGEDLDITFDVDSYFNGLPIGYYRFVKILDVVNKDGSSQQMIVHFDFDLS